MRGSVPVLVRMRAVCLTKADESCGEEDRHKAPTLPHIHPLSLQDGNALAPVEPK